MLGYNAVIPTRIKFDEILNLREKISSTKFDLNQPVHLFQR
jgi:hypothetical protein